ncbi:MAG: hypothetical protein KDN19_15100 [Verrucomicrobiae bacterium]|nr:hypothetical protein [Verrucomicrobiae bacterium]
MNSLPAKWAVLAAFAVGFAVPPALCAQSYSHDEMRGSVVELSATVSSSPPYVTLHWNPSFFTPTGLRAYRRLRGESDWGAGFDLPPDSLSFEDPWAVPGELYEYHFVRTQDSTGHPVADGYLWTGVEVPAVEERGRLILIVDDTISAALETEIARLIRDLAGDGWTVARSEVSRWASVPQVKAVIQSRYAEDPEASKVVFLLGHVPVPYSGIVCPDGHNDPPPEAHHQGAWPADIFYGDMDGVWTDTTADHAIANVSGTRNDNVPGDGRYDQSLIVGEFLPEMAVGRVDLANMDNVSNGASEIDLLRRYLDRHHAFRHRQAPFETLGERAMIDDNFANAFDIAGGASGWASGIAWFGNANTSAREDWVGTLRDQDYLLAYGSGPGSFGGATGVSAIEDFRDTKCRAVFNLLFGSFFGDWESSDNYLRAPLVGTPDSHGLVSVWSGVPRWQLFPLAAGGTMADAYQHVIREVNDPDGPLPPSLDSWTNPDQTHVAIMGDPTLRSHPAKPITGLSQSIVGNQLTLTWTNPASDPTFLGCRIYRSSALDGPYFRVGAPTAPGENSFTVTIPTSETWYYLVRALFLQTTASATYENLAQGILAETQADVPEFNSWAQSLSDAGAGGDPNRDGVSNLVAYAVGAPDGTVSALDRLPRIDDEGRFHLQESGRADIDYEIQVSLDLFTWYTVAFKPFGGNWSLNPSSGYPNQSNVSLSGDVEKIFADGTFAEQLFWRLKVDL